MRIYIVMQHMSYEGDTVVSVYSSYEKATEVRRSLSEDNRYDYIDYWILEECVND